MINVRRSELLGAECSGIRGFSLIEMMIVVVLISILSAIAYPSYLKQVEKSRRSDGQAKLLKVMGDQERYYSQYNMYTTDINNDLNYDPTMPVLSEHGYYSITAAACSSGLPLTNCVKLTASPAADGPQRGTQNMTLDSRDRKTPEDYW